MKEIKRVTTKSLWFAVFYSVMFPIAILMVIFGAINLGKGLGWIAIFVIGIFFAVTGPVFIPILWVKYVKKKRLCRLAITISGMTDTTIDIIGDTTGRTQEQTRNDVRILLRNGWLPGYTFVDQEDRVKKTKSLDVHHAICSHCGASFEFKGTDSKCPYCGRFHKGEVF